MQVHTCNKQLNIFNDSKFTYAIKKLLFKSKIKVCKVRSSK